MMQDHEMRRLADGFSDIETALQRNAASLRERLENATECDKAALIAALQAINAALAIIESARNEE